MSANRATQEGLDYAARPLLFLCAAGKWITQSSAGQDYQEVVISVRDATLQVDLEYIPVAPQVRFGEGLDVDDVDHNEVPVVRRPTR
jgi:hypothetical protein